MAEILKMTFWNAFKFKEAVPDRQCVIFGPYFINDIYDMVYCSGPWTSLYRQVKILIMMTSSNGNIFRVTGPLCGEFTGPGEFPTQRPVTRSFNVFFDLGLNKRLNKHSCGWWFETLSWSLWRHHNDIGAYRHNVLQVLVGSFGWCFWMSELCCLIILHLDTRMLIYIYRSLLLQTIILFISICIYIHIKMFLSL